MGGDGTNLEGELGELHLSAISEAMNQMMGSAATSLSSMLNKMIDISPPSADLVDLKDTLNGEEIDEFLASRFVKISFKMEIGDLVNSEIMQLYPFSFAKDPNTTLSGLVCQIVRVDERRYDYFEYGCRFLGLDPEDENLVLRSIFDAQNFQ